MKIQRQKTTTKNKIAIISTLLVFAILATGLYLFLSNDPRKTQQQINPTDAKVEIEEVSTNPNDKTNAPNTDTPPSTQKDEITNKSVAQMTVSANIVDGIVYIRGGINNAATNNGNCYAQLSNGTQTVKKDTILLQNPSTTDCKTIAINLSELSEGTWLVQLHYVSDSMEGVSNEVSLEVK